MCVFGRAFLQLCVFGAVASPNNHIRYMTVHVGAPLCENRLRDALSLKRPEQVVKLLAHIDLMFVCTVV